jgi:hypothetical protein
MKMSTSQCHRESSEFLLCVTLHHDRKKLQKDGTREDFGLVVNALKIRVFMDVSAQPKS